MIYASLVTVHKDLHEDLQKDFMKEKILHYPVLFGVKNDYEEKYEDFTKEVRKRKDFRYIHIHHVLEFLGLHDFTPISETFFYKETK